MCSVRRSCLGQLSVTVTGVTLGTVSGGIVDLDCSSLSFTNHLIMSEGELTRYVFQYLLLALKSNIWPTQQIRAPNRWFRRSEPPELHPDIHV